MRANGALLRASRFEAISLRHWARYCIGAWPTGCCNRSAGTEAHVRALSGDAAASVQAAQRHFAFHYRSAAHFVEVFRTCYGPVNKAFATQTPDRAEALAAELVDLLDSLNRAGPSSLVVPSEYLEVVVIRA